MFEFVADIALYEDHRRKKMTLRCCIARHLYRDRIDREADFAFGTTYNLVYRIKFNK